MIDGDHTLTGVKQDWQWYSPLVRQGRLVAFHDIALHHAVPRCQVHKVWTDLIRVYRSEEFVDYHDERGWGPWGGLGVIHRGRKACAPHWW